MRYLFVIGDVAVTPGAVGDLAITTGGRPAVLAPALPFAVWDAITGGTQITDLTTPDGVTVLDAVTDSNGQPPLFRGPDGYATALYVDFGGSQRVPVFPQEALLQAISTALAGGVGTITSLAITDSTSLGRSLLTAVNAAAALSLVGGVSSTDARLSDTRTPTANSVTDSSVSAAAAISADKLADGTTRKVLTSAERGKIAAAFVSGSGTGGTIYLRTLAQGVMPDDQGLDGDIQLVAVTG